jgi:jumonji domain-containing protein 7
MISISQITQQQWSDEYVEKRQPCLIVDGLHDWPALARWSPQYMKTACAHQTIDVQVSHSGKFRYQSDGSPLDPSSQYVLTAVPFAVAADWIIERPSGHAYYISQADILPHKDLLADLRLYRPIDRRMVNLWFGSGDTVTPLHYDAGDNWFAQIFGTKTITLIAPAHTDAVYPVPSGRTTNLSLVDLDSPDMSQYPRFAEVETCVLSVTAGQLLYLPAFWWHHVRAEGTSISVNQWDALDLENALGENATRHWIAMFARDRWRNYRAGGKVSATRMLNVADGLARINPDLAVLAVAAVLDDALRWPGVLAPYISTISSIESQVRVMTNAIVQKHDAGIAFDQLSEILATMRQVLKSMLVVAASDVAV